LHFWGALVRLAGENFAFAAGRCNLLKTVGKACKTDFRRREGRGWRRAGTGKMIWLKSTLLVLAPLFLALGLTMPLMRFETLYFFSDRPSLLQIIGSLWSGGDQVLALLVLLLSVLFPVVKLIGVAAEAIGAAGGRTGDLAGGGPQGDGQEGSGRAGGRLLYRLVPYLAKWSMMDVMLVAIVIFAAKTSGLATAVTQPGLWFYAGSAILVSLLHPLLRGRAG
jgi:paraquat-inducible protein A